MKRNILLLVSALIVAALVLSCSAAKNGAVGPTGLTVLSFQDGVYPSNAYAGTADTDLIDGADADNHFGSGGVDTIGYSGGQRFRGLVKFDVSSVTPPDVTVEDAYLTITTSWALTNTITAYALTTAWDESQATWNSRLTATPWLAPGGDIGAMQDSKYSGPVKLVFKLNAALVQSWITAPAQNYGILLKAADETDPVWTNIYTRESGTPAYRPMLTIYYKLP